MRLAQQFSMHSIALGIDIGGTKIRLGLIRQDGTVLQEMTLPTRAAEQRVMDQLFLGIDTMLRVWEERGEEQPLAGIGIGSAGQIDGKHGIVHYASDLIPGYTGTPLRALVEQRFGLPVYVDNDVNVMALAEGILGAGRGLDHLVCLALGTGVGGALITDGRLVHGINGGAGEVGHMTVNLKGPRCICGSRGCLEIYASGTSIARRYNERLLARKPAEPPAVVSTRQVVERWLGGEPEARRVMEAALSSLAAAIAGLVHLFNPQAVIIGGGLAEVGAPLFAALERKLLPLAMPSMLRELQLLPAALGSASNMIGAALQVWLEREA